MKGKEVNQCADLFQQERYHVDHSPHARTAFHDRYDGDIPKRERVQQFPLSHPRNFNPLPSSKRSN